MLYGGLSYLCSPSAALQQTVKLVSSTDTKNTLPIFDFIGRRHNLEALRTSMELALRKAACRVYAMQVSNRNPRFNENNNILKNIYTN